ncbi:hypothetical protein GGI09_009022, partial [Coemansia sp. S100]
MTVILEISDNDKVFKYYHPDPDCVLDEVVDRIEKRIGRPDGTVFKFLAELKHDEQHKFDIFG